MVASPVPNSPMTGAAPGAAHATQNCPRCSQKMEAGWIAIVGRLNWVDHIDMVDGSVFSGDPIIRQRDTWGGAAHIRSWRCTPCGVLIAGYRDGLS